MITSLFYASTCILFSTVLFSNLAQAGVTGDSNPNNAVDDGSSIIIDPRNYTRALRDPGLTSVTSQYGNSLISMKDLPFERVSELRNRPWSAWWYPFKEGFLFRGSNSALAKYDLFRQNRYREKGLPIPRSAVAYEQENYDLNAKSWEGLCDAWSLAALSMPEPKRPVTIRIGHQDVTFSIADLKGLLIKTFEAVDDNQLKVYGQKFTGDYRGSIWDDPFPNEFHRFLEVFLFEKKKPFVMDHDPGPEVWNVPVFKTRFRVSAIPNDPNSVFVTAWVHSAEAVTPRQMDFVGTREAVRTYHYILHGTRNQNEDLIVTSGEWAVGPDDHIDSEKDHPDFMTVIRNPSELVRKSFNPEIEVELIDEILRKAY